MLLTLIATLTALIIGSHTALVVRPHNTTAVLGESVTLPCSTDIFDRPVNWHCRGTCSANTSDHVVYLLMAGRPTKSYSHRVNISRYNRTYVPGLYTGY